MLVGHALPVLPPAGLPEGCTVPSHGVPWSSPWSFGHSVSSRWWTARAVCMARMGVEPFDSERLDEWTSTRSGDEKDGVWRLQGLRQWGEAREHAKGDAIPMTGPFSWEHAGGAHVLPPRVSPPS